MARSRHRSRTSNSSPGLARTSCPFAAAPSTCVFSPSEVHSRLGAFAAAGGTPRGTPSTSHFFAPEKKGRKFNSRKIPGRRAALSRLAVFPAGAGGRGNYERQRVVAGAARTPMAGPSLRPLGRLPQGSAAPGGSAQMWRIRSVKMWQAAGTVTVARRGRAWRHRWRFYAAGRVSRYSWRPKLHFAISSEIFDRP